MREAYGGCVRSQDGYAREEAAQETCPWPMVRMMTTPGGKTGHSEPRTVAASVATWTPST